MSEIESNGNMDLSDHIEHVDLDEEKIVQKSRKRKVRGILGVPKESPMLFSFNSGELWPDDQDNSDNDSDLDYEPSKRSAPSKKSSLARGSINGTKHVKQIIVNGSNLDHQNGVVNETLNEVVLPKKSKSKAVKRKANIAQKPKAKKSTKKTDRSESKKSENSTKKQNLENKKLDFNTLVKPIKYDFEQKLSEDVLIKIFLMLLDLELEGATTLIKLSLVCEKWRQLIISTPILWKRLDLSNFAMKKFPVITFNNLQECNRLFSSVRELNLSGWNGENVEKIMETVVQNSNFDLETLIIKNCRNISTNFLKAIIKNCPNLKMLDISAITYFFGHNITFFDYIQSDSNTGRQRNSNVPRTKTSSHQNCQNPFSTPAFRPLIESCGKNLVKLYMSENMMPSFTSCWSLVLQFCPNLEVCDISNVTSLGARSASISIERFQSCCPRLRVLRAANMSFQTEPSSVTPGFPSLEELSIPFHENFVMPMPVHHSHSDMVIEQLTKGAENLTLLDIRGSRFVSPRGLVKIPTWSLKHLWISNCNRMQDETLEMVFTKWNKTLIDVDLSWNRSESCLNACISTICEVEPEQSQLKSIRLRGSAVSYEMIRKLINSCPKLTLIDLQSCRGLPRGIKRAYSGEEFVQLRNEMLEGKYD